MTATARWQRSPRRSRAIISVIIYIYDSVPQLSPDRHYLKIAVVDPVSPTDEHVRRSYRSPRKTRFPYCSTCGDVSTTRENSQRGERFGDRIRDRCNTYSKPMQRSGSEITIRISKRIQRNLPTRIENTVPGVKSVGSREFRSILLPPPQESVMHSGSRRNDSPVRSRPCSHREPGTRIVSCSHSAHAKTTVGTHGTVPRARSEKRVSIRDVLGPTVSVRGGTKPPSTKGIRRDQAAITSIIVGKVA